MKKLEGAGLRGQTAGQTSLSTVEHHQDPNIITDV